MLKTSGLNRAQTGQKELQPGKNGVEQGANGRFLFGMQAFGYLVDSVF